MEKKIYQLEDFGGIEWVEEKDISPRLQRAIDQAKADMESGRTTGPMSEEEFKAYLNSIPHASQEEETTEDESGIVHVDYMSLMSNPGKDDLSSLAASVSRLTRLAKSTGKPIVVTQSNGKEEGATTEEETAEDDSRGGEPPQPLAPEPS